MCMLVKGWEWLIPGKRAAGVWGCGQGMEGVLRVESSHLRSRTSRQLGKNREGEGCRDDQESRLCKSCQRCWPWEQQG